MFVNEIDGKGRRRRGWCGVKRREQISWENVDRGCRSGVRGEVLVESRASPEEVVLLRPFSSRRCCFDRRAHAEEVEKAVEGQVESRIESRNRREDATIAG